MKDIPNDLRADSTAPDPIFEPTRAAALDRLRHFAPRAGRDYAAKRNHDLPGHPHVSTLSPYIRHRAVTEAELCAAVLDRHGPAAAEKFVSEVCWRTYWKGWLERRPGYWNGYKRDLARARDRVAAESGLRREWEDACEGRTGIAPFDDWARELGRTGYVHNHARMWFASVWIHTLRLPWVLGADLFLRNLLDGDPASNTLQWRWVAGLHTRGKAYGARASNIGKYTGGRYDPETLGRRLAREADPLEEAGERPDPRPVPEDADWDRAGRTGLLLHEDDLHPAHLWARGLRPVAGAVLVAPEGRSTLQVSHRVHAFTRALAEDAARRWDAVCPFDAPTDDVDAVAHWTVEQGLDRVVTPYAPVGPLADKLHALESRLDIPVVRPLRAWDVAAWPWATAGFFKLKAKMPRILETIPADGGPDFRGGSDDG